MRIFVTSPRPWRCQVQRRYLIKCKWDLWIHGLMCLVVLGLLRKRQKSSWDPLITITHLLSFAAQPREALLNHGVNLARARDMEHLPARKRHVDIYSQSVWKWLSNKSRMALMETQTLTSPCNDEGVPVQHSSPPQNQNNVWQRLKANSISACSSRWKQYSRGLGVSSSFTFNCKVLVKRVGNLGVRLLRDCWKLRNWTQRGTRLKRHSSKTVRHWGPFFKRDNVRSALLLQRVRLALKNQKKMVIILFLALTILSAPKAEHYHGLSSQRKASWHHVRPDAQGHHRCTPPCTTSPPRAEESWGHAEAKAKAWVCGLLNLFSGEINNWLFNPDTHTHTWSTKMLSPSWIKLPGKPWAPKMT